MPFADALSPLLGRLRLRYAQSALPAFLAWWTGQLRDCIPKRWQHLLSAPEQSLRLQWSAEGLTPLRVVGETSTELERIRFPVDDEGVDAFEVAVSDLPAHAPRVLLLPPGAALRRTLNLPAAALNNARSMAAFEIDRQTPFRGDQVMFDCRITVPPAGARTFAVDLAVIPKDAYQGLLERVGPLAARLDAVDLDVGGRPAGYNFLPLEARRAHDHRPFLINLGLVLGGVLCLGLAMAQLVDNRGEAVSQLQAEIESQRAAARITAQLKSGLEDAVKAANFLAEHRAQQPSMLELLRLLTELLPDDTYLERLSYSGDTASISLQSSSAAQMVERLQNESRFENPSLVGAIQPDPRSGKDRATLTVRFAGKGATP